MKQLLQTDFIGRRFVVAVCICAPLVLSAPGVCLAEDASAFGGKAVSTTETQDQPQAALDANQMTLASESLPVGAEQSATADQTPAETDASGSKQSTQAPEQKPSPSPAATPASTEANGEDISSASKEEQADSSNATSDTVTDTVDDSPEDGGADGVADDSEDEADNQTGWLRDQPPRILQLSVELLSTPCVE